MNCKKLCILIIIFIIFTGVSAFATDPENSISNYDVSVRINTDGSLNITENIKFTSLRGYNNVAIFIEKQDGEEIEINNVYMLDKNGYIECTEISQEQWDINAFMGTYSITEEFGYLRLKVYGRFSSDNGTVVVQYTVKNAVKRYYDVAEYKRTHIFKDQNNYISNIDISVYLPIEANMGLVKSYLHGVLVGRKYFENNHIINFHIPDIVPREYVEARVVFPENIVFNAPYSDIRPKLPEILQEEEEYINSDKSDLLRARESAANKAGRRAMAEKLAQRARITFSILSLIGSGIGLYVLFKIHKKLRKLKKLPLPKDLRHIVRLTPAEVRFVISRGRTGARGIMASLLHLVSMGALEIKTVPSKYIRSEHNRNIMVFSIKEGLKPSMSLSEAFLYELIVSAVKIYGEFNPDMLWEKAQKTEEAQELKSYYDEWESRVLKEYFGKNILESDLVFYRNLGIITGAFLFFAGCIIPVAFSIWAGYLMLPVGLVLFMYSIRMQKYTDYATTQYAVWKEIKHRFSSMNIDLSNLPAWMGNGSVLLSYAIALTAEKNPAILNEILDLGVKEVILNDYDVMQLSQLIKQTMHIMTMAFSSVQDAN